MSRQDNTQRQEGRTSESTDKIWRYLTTIEQIERRNKWRIDLAKSCIVEKNYYKNNKELDSYATV